MTIKHLVLSGGSWKGFNMIGALKKLIDEKYIVLNEIETLWGTSVGTLVSVFICLKMDIVKIIEFVKNVPLNNITNASLNTILEIYNESGLLDKKIFLGFLKSPFCAKDLNIETITLKEFYDYSGKELNLFCVNYNTVETTIFNYKNYPDVKLLDVIYCSCSLPMIFKPNKINDVVYLDGGLKAHYPSKYCLEKYENKEIFGIGSRTNIELQNNFSNLLDFMSKLMEKLLFLKQRDNFNLLENQLIIDYETSDYTKLINILSDNNERNKLITHGYKIAEDYLKKTK